MGIESRSISSSLMLISVLCASLALFAGSASAQLTPYYYYQSCPPLPYIVKSVVQGAVANERRMGASLLRLFFHDCFVNGCDASILLDDTSTFQGEKGSGPNKNSARGFEVIDEIKRRVEQVCPGVVSCADLLAITARDSVALLGGPYWDVKLGRRDSKTASLTAANTGIPALNSSVSTLISRYQTLGLSTTDLVALNGAHTIGAARCVTFRDRVYGVRESSPIDSGFAAERRAQCPAERGSGDANLAPLDLQSPAVFDNLFFKNLIAKKGLLHIDQQLYGGGSAEADGLVRRYSEDVRAFKWDFVAAMIKMGDISPLTGSQGEVRSNCRAVNA